MPALQVGLHPTGHGSFLQLLFCRLLKSFLAFNLFLRWVEHQNRASFGNRVGPKFELFFRLTWLKYLFPVIKAKRCFSLFGELLTLILYFHLSLELCLLNCMKPRLDHLGWDRVRFDFYFQLFFFHRLFFGQH